MKKLLILFLFVLPLVGCQSPETQVTATLDTVSETRVFESPLAHSSPLAVSKTSFVPTAVPPPSAGKGTIVGHFVDIESGAPPGAEVSVFLGTLSMMDPSDSYVITMLPTDSPQAITDVHGYFAFLDIEPGTYAMVIWTPMNSWIVSEPETEEAVLVTVDAGQVTDLGEKAVKLP